MILIFGQKDYYNKRIFEELEKRSLPYMPFDSKSFPYYWNLLDDIDTPKNSELAWKTAETTIQLSDIKSAYWYCYQGIQVPNVSSEKAMFYKREIEALLGSMVMNIDCLWVNKPETIFKHRFKAHQLKQMSQIGIRIPKSIVTNDIEQIKTFYDTYNKKVLYKPLSYGAPKNLTDDDFKPDSIEELTRIPILLQEKIDGMDVRVHLVGDEAFPTKVARKHDDDYKTNRDLDIDRIELPDTVLEDCRRIAKLFDLVLTGVDFRQNDDGEYVFFEANPSPQFAIYEDECDYNITSCLVDLLAKGK